MPERGQGSHLQRWVRRSRRRGPLVSGPPWHPVCSCRRSVTRISGPSSGRTARRTPFRRASTGAVAPGGGGSASFLLAREVVGSREVTGASCGRHAFGLTDVAVPDRRPVRGGFGPHHVRPDVMERSPSGSNRWHLDGTIFRIEWTDEQVLVPIVSARSQAASSASGPCG